MKRYASKQPSLSLISKTSDPDLNLQNVESLEFSTIFQRPFQYGDSCWGFPIDSVSSQQFPRLQTSLYMCLEEPAADLEDPAGLGECAGLVGTEEVVAMQELGESREMAKLPEFPDVVELVGAVGAVGLVGVG